MGTIRCTKTRLNELFGNYSTEMSQNLDYCRLKIRLKCLQNGEILCDNNSNNSNNNSLKNNTSFNQEQTIKRGLITFDLNIFGNKI